MLCLLQQAFGGTENAPPNNNRQRKTDGLENEDKLLTEYWGLENEK